MVQDFARRYVAAGGKIHSGSDPGSLLPAYAVHVEFELMSDAGFSPLVAIQSASLNVARAWGKDRDYGSVEKGKVADLVIVRGDVIKDISSTQNVEKVFMDGKPVDISFHPEYRNPIPRPLSDRFLTEPICRRRGIEGPDSAPGSRDIQDYRDGSRNRRFRVQRSLPRDLI